MSEWQLQHVLQALCQKADIILPERVGWHALRRRIVTEIYCHSSAKELPIISYFRWSNKQRHLSQLPTYAKISPDESDREILSQHPLLEMWELIMPYLCEWHPEYRTDPKVQQLYNENK